MVKNEKVAWQHMRIIALLLVSSMVLAGCSSSNDPDGTTTTDATGGATATKTASNTDTGTSGTSGGSGSTSGGVVKGSMEIKFTTTSLNVDAGDQSSFQVNATFKDSKGAVVNPPGISWRATRVLSKDTEGVPTGNAPTEAASGSKLPGNFTLTLSNAGTVTVRAFVKANTFSEQNVSLDINVNAKTGIFFDGAEGDGSAFTFTSNVYVADVSTGETMELPTEHPDGSWEKSTVEPYAGTASWWSQYPDNYRARMTIASVTMPAPGMLTFWMRGGAEANGMDGLFILVNDEEKGYYSDDLGGWAQVQIPLPSGDVKIEFRFDSDLSCSDQTNIPGSGGLICGNGFDKGGIWIDDIAIV